MLGYLDNKGYLDYSSKLTNEVKMQTKKSLFIELFGDSPTIKVLDFLLTERELDFSISDMARNAGIGRATLYRVWNDLIRNQIILPTRTIGKANLYKLNISNPKIKKLIEMDDMLILEELRKKMGKTIKIEDIDLYTKGLNERTLIKKFDILNKIKIKKEITR